MKNTFYAKTKWKYLQLMFWVVSGWVRKIISKAHISRGYWHWSGMRTWYIMDWLLDVALTERARLRDWVPVDNRLWPSRLRGSYRANSLCPGRRNLFSASAYALTDCSPAVIKDIFYQRLRNLLRARRRDDLVFLAGYINARVGWLPANEMHPGGPFGLDCCRLENKELLLALLSDH